MKKHVFLSIITIGFIMITGCNSKKESTSKPGDWSAEDVLHFRQNCENGNKEKNWTPAQMDTYCNCVLQQLQSYANYDEAMNKADFDNIKPPCKAKAVGVIPQPGQ